MPNFSELLQKLNLNRKQVAIFLSLVKLGKATAAAIARDSGVTRTHVYDLTEELIEKGLVSVVEEHSIKVYEAVDHAGLLAYVSREQTDLREISKKLEQMAGDFNGLQVGLKQKTKVRFFDGIEGVKNLYEEIKRDLSRQSASSEVLTIFSPEKANALIPGFYFFDFPVVTVRDIVCEDAMATAYKKQIQNSKNKVQYKMWPEGRGIFPTDNIAWLNKVAYVDLTGYPSGIIVENVAMVRTFTMMFNAMWMSLDDKPRLRPSTEQ